VQTYGTGFAEAYGPIVKVAIFYRSPRPGGGRLQLGTQRDAKRGVIGNFR